VQEPLDNPKQVTFEKLVIDVVGLPKLVTVKGTVKLHAFASLIVTVWFPAAKPTVLELAVNAPPSNEKLYKEYGGKIVVVPVVILVTVAVALATPQLAVDGITVADVISATTPTLNVVAKAHPLTSVTEMECVP
jgi:hypothetical protein